MTSAALRPLSNYGMTGDASHVLAACMLTFILFQQEEVHCWAAAAEALSDQPGLRVVLPDLHSNNATAPAAISSNDAVKLVTELADAFQVSAAVVYLLHATSCCLGTT